jgi:hypothetical protein
MLDYNDITTIINALTSAEHQSLAKKVIDALYVNSCNTIPVTLVFSNILHLTYSISLLNHDGLILLKNVMNIITNIYTQYFYPEYVTALHTLFTERIAATAPDSIGSLEGLPDISFAYDSDIDIF